MPARVESQTCSQQEALKTGLAEALKGATPLEARIVCTDYLSFQFSMGDPYVQKLLLYTTRMHYDANEFTREFPTTSALDAAIRPRIEKLYLPGYHAIPNKDPERTTKEFNRENVVKTFMDNWDYHRKVLSGIEGVEDDCPSMSHFDVKMNVLDSKPREDILLEAARDMALRDSHYVIVGRPRPSDDNGDPYESFVRRHIVHAESLTSEGLDASLYDMVFAEMREILETLDTRDYKGECYHLLYGLRQAIGELQYAWKNKHKLNKWEEI